MRKGRFIQEGRQVFWLRDHLLPHLPEGLLPPVACWGFVSPHSSATARDFHPVPLIYLL